MSSFSPIHLGLWGRPEAIERVLGELLSSFATQNIRHCGILVDPPAEAPAIPAQLLTAVTQYRSLEDFLASLTGPNSVAAQGVRMLVDLRGDPAAFASLRTSLPDDLALCDGASLHALAAACHGQQLPAVWRHDLSQTRSVLEALFEQIQDEILLLDASATIIDANAQARDRRHTTKAALIGHSYFSLPDHPRACHQQAGPMHAEVHCPVSRTLQDHQMHETTLPLVEPDGSLRTLRLAAYPVLNADGRLENILEVRRDISDMVAMHRRLQQSERLAAIGELATYIAHEIRNPLFAIAGFANALMRSASLDDDARQKAGIIVDESKRLDAILKSTLNFARPIQPAGSEAAPTPLDLAQLARDTAQLFTMRCDDLGIPLRIEIAEDLPLARADGELIKQCLINALKNSIEAMEESASPPSGQIILRSVFAPPLVGLEVEDTGPGIPEAILPRIFNPFFSTKNRGSGLGLAMSKKILEELGGTIRVNSEEGRGATVTMLVPAIISGEVDALPRRKDGNATLHEL